MSKKQNELKKVEELVQYYRKRSDQDLLGLYSIISRNARKEIKQAYNIVLRERGLKP